ncbi:MAG: eukaryotic-like serine/threonine-protein kinase [Microbacteriaceae bacterium]|nr:eukaryotic-like serine/threonine-protein kinase [Microbacteriaceae bacterium]
MPDPVTDGVIGTLVGDRYRIEALIGRGGMASVYRATDESLGRSVAIKRMQPTPGGAADLRRQRTEIETLAALNHHALVTLFDAGVDVSDEGERAYLVMELVEGPDLRTFLERGTPDPRQLAHIAADLAEALHYVHSKGVVHRDIKPANVLLAPSDLPDRDYHARLADFGIAHLIGTSHLTAVGTVIGTASYLSPEQALGRAVGPATDIYALGLVLLEALTGRKAFEGSSVESVQARLNRDPEIPGDVSDGWRALLASMTARETLLRASAMDVAVTARELATHQTATETHASGTPVTAVQEAVPQGSAGTEDTVAFAELLEPTKRYSTTTPGASTPPPTPSAAASAPAAAATTAATAATAVYGVGPNPDEPTPLAVGSQPPTPRKGRSRAWITASAVAVVALVGLAVWLIPLATATPSPTPSPYPSVSGELGTHLKQLQESVTP